LQIAVEFVRSAVGVEDLPDDPLPEIALVGRSNVGKSSLINALVRQRVARTSAAPGKTRLANIYRVARGAGSPLYLIDLPGYGYARGGAASVREFEELTRGYFDRDLQDGRDRRERLRPSRDADTQIRGEGSASGRAGGGAPAAVGKKLAGLLLIDSRHPGLQSDVDAWSWLRTVVVDGAIVATKIDKLARGERIRALRELESVYETSVLPVSAVTGEGLDELWKLIDRLANSHNSSRHSSSPPRATAPHRPKKAEPSAAPRPRRAPRRK
jgi:GTP-binding protein